MGIAGCYDLTLDCDAEGCDAGDYGEVKRSTFVKEHGGAARAAARRVGWHLDLKEGTCTCPACRVKEIQTLRAKYGSLYKVATELGTSRSQLLRVLERCERKKKT